jgi:hypothetical protein
MSKLKLALLVASVAALLTGGGPASATVHNLGALSLGDTKPTGSIGSAGKFTDEWDFTVLAPARLITSSVFNYNIPAHQNILGLHLSLFEGATLLASSGTGTGGTGETVLTTPVFPGHKYDFIVTGTVPKEDQGVYDLNIFVSTVPELSTWAMMLVGFGLVGLQLRHKKRSAAATA